MTERGTMDLWSMLYASTASTKNVTSGWRLTTEVIVFVAVTLSLGFVLLIIGCDRGDRQEWQAKIANLDQ